VSGAGNAPRQLCSTTLRTIPHRWSPPWGPSPRCLRNGSRDILLVLRSSDLGVNAGAHKVPFSHELAHRSLTGWRWGLEEELTAQGCADTPFLAVCTLQIPVIEC